MQTVLPWRPVLGQFGYPETAAEAHRRLTRSLDSAVGAYMPTQFAPDIADRLAAEMTNCEYLIGQVLLERPEAAVQAEACIEALKKSLEEGASQSYALRSQQTEQQLKTDLTVLLAFSGASALVSGYHGYKRNDSTGWALWWGFMGALFPIVTPVVAIAQGYGKRVKS